MCSPGLLRVHFTTPDVTKYQRESHRHRQATLWHIANPQEQPTLSTFRLHLDGGWVRDVTCPAMLQSYLTARAEVVCHPDTSSPGRPDSTLLLCSLQETGHHITGAPEADPVWPDNCGSCCSSPSHPGTPPQ